LLGLELDGILKLLMDAISGSTWLWVGFSVFIVCMLSLDLGLFNRRAHAIRYREAWIWSAVWVTLALIFAGLVLHYQGSQRGLEFLTGLTSAWESQGGIREALHHF